MSYSARWELVKEIGSGGQGTVHSCIDKKQFDLDRDVFPLLHRWFQVHNSPHNLYAKEQNTRKSTDEMFKVSITTLIQSEDPKNHFAIKVLHPITEQKNSDSALLRTAQEIEAIRSVNHPNLIELIDADPNNKWYVSKFYSSGTLDGHLPAFAGNFAHSLELFHPIVSAVAELHKKGIVHRDIKPHNIFISTNGEPIVGDLGLSYFIDKELNNERLTGSQESVGTKYWMPPWAMGPGLQDVSPAFDVFSLGRVFWSLLSGQSFLRLWYWNRDPFNVEKMFQNAQYISLAKEIFSKTIVEHENDCLSDAKRLLDLVEEIQTYTKPREPLLLQKAAKCLACGNGIYQAVVEKERSKTQQFGLTPHMETNFIISACDNCGHVQLFRFKGDDPPYWKGKIKS